MMTFEGGLIQSLCEAFDVEPRAFEGPAYDESIRWPRFVAMHLLYRDCGMPLAHVAQRFGSEDGSIVAHADRRIETGLASPQVGAVLKELLAGIRSRALELSAPALRMSA